VVNHCKNIRAKNIREKISSVKISAEKISVYRKKYPIKLSMIVERLTRSVFTWEDIGIGQLTVYLISGQWPLGHIININIFYVLNL
jgi:hypothetical protein